MSVEAASNNSSGREERDVFRDTSTPANSDNASGDGMLDENPMLANVLKHAFGGTTVPLPVHGSVPEHDDFDDFEAAVLTTCLLSSVTPVAVPVDFEQQVLQRVQKSPTIPSPTPKPLPSPLRINPSRELFLRYRKVLGVTLSLLFVGSIALAMYISNNSGTKEETREQPVPSIVVPEKPPALELRQPANKEFMKFQPKKQKPRRKKDNIIRGA